jgi:hypothetical protein
MAPPPPPPPPPPDDHLRSFRVDISAARTHAARRRRAFAFPARLSQALRRSRAPGARIRTAAAGAAVK